MKTDSGSLDEKIVKIKNRINEKIRDYENYAFTTIQDCSLKTFFDLAQEYESRYDLFCLCVLVPKIFFDYECVLYLFDENGNLKDMCNSADLYNKPTLIRPKTPVFYREPTLKGDSYFVPIKGNREPSDNYPGKIEEGVLGLFEICAASELSDNMKFFLEKYVNRIGFQLHNRIINEKNREHLNFIKSLVNDIGHNVIVPNMFFKLFFRRMKGKIDRAIELGRELESGLIRCVSEHEAENVKEFNRLSEELNYNNESMAEQFQEIIAHYEQTSLFLETLLRRSHFEKGRYVLVPKRINIYEKIIRPQLERYLPRLEEKGIEIHNRAELSADKETMVVADAGLISQAYANFFSNAIKYTREVKDQSGERVKYISFNMEFMENYFQKNEHGIKLNMFSTGQPLSNEDAENIYEEGYRGGNTEDEYGTGHGLQFIREVIELHNGVVGYSAKPHGNDFYFILPA